MKKLSTTTRWLMLGGLLSAPYALLFVVGSFWLYERGWLWVWLVANAVVTLAGWFVVRRWRMQIVTTPPKVATVDADSRWAPAGEQAWREVEAIAARSQNEDIPLDDPQRLWQLVYEVLNTVARRFRPESRDPVLDIPVPYVLRVVELVSADLRVAFSEHVPGSHILTLHDFQRMRKLASWGQQLYLVYRVVRMGLDPVASLLREARDMAGGHLAEASTSEIKRWAISYAVKKSGYYAIQLYSGQLILSDVELESFQSRRSGKDVRRAGERDDVVTGEPLRVLVIGQVKAGKSSLINALFGETRAAVDVVPCTKGIDPFVLERDGIQRAIILDSVGTAEPGERKRPFDAMKTEVLTSDLVIVVCSATTAARAPDRQLLNDVRSFFQNDATRIIPPLLVVVTHIDQLRPWQEWNPPYDLVHPSGTKAQNILAVMQVIATDLNVAIENVVPVCLHPERLYNVEDGFMPAIMQSMTEAQRTKYQRCLRQFHDEEYWRKIWEQAKNSGRLLWRAVDAARKSY